MRHLWLALPLLLLATASHGRCASDEQQSYRQAIQQRSTRIVEPLGLEDPAQHQRVVDLVANQYHRLKDIHASRDQLVAAAGDDKTAALDAYHREVVGQHRKFCAQLLAELEAGQVDQIKDGMTYGVVPHTYAAYLQLLPDLSEEQRRYIHANLLEAREFAMDAGSSEEKHAWFGKYKGRINNYLSKAGYDLKQAEHDLVERTRKQESQDGNP